MVSLTLLRQAYVEFTSQQAATAAKQKIVSFGEGQQYVKKHTVTYSNPNVNPFRTLPKDAPMRAAKEGQPNRSSGSGGYNNDRNTQSSGNTYNNFRGRAPGYNSNRGNMNNVGGGFNNNRNFSGPQQMGGMGGGFQAPMGGFQGGNMGGQFGGFNRGGMMNNMRGNVGGMRGGRGGMGNGMMGSMPMGGMPMGGMGMGGMGGMPNMGQMGGVMPGKISSNKPIALRSDHSNPFLFGHEPILIE